MPDVPTRKDVLAARERIREYVAMTPLLTNSTINQTCGLDIHFKCENLQKSGSFKYRGAANALLNLTSEQLARGVATHSSGNHGAALAAVAQRLATTATIVVPDTASAFKRDAIRRYGGVIIDSGATLAERETKLAQVVKRTGAVFIPPYDDPHIIAGQGTAGLELEQQLDSVDEVWLPVGGGGLAAGNVLACGQQMQVVAAEPELAGDAFQSLACGQRQPAMPPVTCADGLRTALGELNFKILNRYSLPIKLVSDAEIVAAQKLAMSCLKLVIETSSAVPLAGLIKYGAHNAASRRVVILISGGNVNLDRL